MNSGFRFILPALAIMLPQISAPAQQPFASFVAASVSPAPADPCLSQDLAANPTRPNWSSSAQTTQCNVLEYDSGWLLQPMGAGVSQQMLPGSMRYGLTPKLDFRWGAPAPVVQSGGSSIVHGVTDQWFSARYRFLEQSRFKPALALSYAIKDPSANPAKGFGTGYVDHQFLFIASRDFGRAHFDFNTLATLAGGRHGSDTATQYGLALSLAVIRKCTWMLEIDGGPQPFTSNKYGAALSGGAIALHPWLVLDAAYTRVFTAGSPRALSTVGITFARRSPFLPLPSSSRIAHWLGR